MMTLKEIASMQAEIDELKEENAKLRLLHALRNEARHEIGAGDGIAIEVQE